MLRPRLAIVPCLLAFTFLLGCSSDRFPAVPKGGIGHTGIQGYVHGGQQPVAGAAIQLYTIGLNGDGSAALSLLSQPAYTDANGNFTITGLYSCSNATQVFITATGGNPGLSSGNNAQIALMTALGACTSLRSGTFIEVNELTTVAAVASLAPYMTSASAVGANPAHTAALDLAFSASSQLVNPSTGSAPGLNVPSGYSVPVATLNTLADIVATCVNSAGGLAGTATPCGQLFALTTPLNVPPPTDTILALLELFENPTLNTTSIFNLPVPIGPFQPTLGSQPPDFSIRLLPPASQLALQLSTAALSFPSTLVSGTSSPLSVTITNTSGAAIAFSATPVGANADDFGGSTSCISPLAAHASCVLNLTFTPLGVGARSGYLAVVSDSTNSPQYVQLTGNATPASALPIASVSATAMNLSLSGLTQDLTLSNTGSAGLLIKSITTASGAFPVSSTCGPSLPAGMSCIISILNHAAAHDPHGSIAPANAYSFDQLAISTNGTIPLIYIPLSAHNFIETASTAGPFGPILVGSQSSGTLALNYTADPSSPLPTTCPGSGLASTDFSVSPGMLTTSPITNPFLATCSYTVTFMPTSAGNKSARLTFGTQGAYLPLTGVGVSSTPNVAFSSSALAFPAESVPESITLTNSSSSTVSIQSITTSGSFSQTNTCGASLAARSSCTIMVTGISPATSVFQIADTINFGELLPGTLTVVDSVGTQTASLLIDNTPAGSVGVAEVGRTSLGALALTSLYSTGNVVLASSLGGDFHGGSCTSVNGTCSSSISFIPLATGVRLHTFTLTDSDSLQDQTVYSGYLAAVGFADEPIGISFQLPALENFTVGTTHTLSAIVANVGTTTLNVGSPNSFTGPGANEYAFQPTNSNCGILAVGARCTLSFVFRPSVPGVRSVSLQFSDLNSGDTFVFPMIEYAVTNTWGPPMPAMTAITFASTAVGTTSAPAGLAVTSSDHHAVTASISSPFSLSKSTCVQDETSCQLEVLFSPTQAGIPTATLTLTDAFTGAVTSLSVSGQGGSSKAQLPVIRPAISSQPPHAWGGLFSVRQAR